MNFCQVASRVALCVTLTSGAVTLLTAQPRTAQAGIGCSGARAIQYAEFVQARPEGVLYRHWSNWPMSYGGRSGLELDGVELDGTWESRGTLWQYIKLSVWRPDTPLSPDVEYRDPFEGYVSIVVDQMRLPEVLDAEVVEITTYDGASHQCAVECDDSGWTETGSHKRPRRALEVTIETQTDLRIVYRLEPIGSAIDGVRWFEPAAGLIDSTGTLTLAFDNCSSQYCAHLVAEDPFTGAVLRSEPICAATSPAPQKRDEPVFMFCDEVVAARGPCEPPSAAGGTGGSTGSGAGGGNAPGGQGGNTTAGTGADGGNTSGSGGSKAGATSAPTSNRPSRSSSGCQIGEAGTVSQFVASLVLLAVMGWRRRRG